MRSTKPPTVTVYKNSTHGDLPAFMGIIHRHFQKSLPLVGDLKEITLNAPVDLLDMIVPPALLDKIESIEVTYGRK